MNSQPVLLQINVSANRGSTGKIAEQINMMAAGKGWKTFFAYGRSANPSQSELIRIGSDFNVREHGMESRLLDNHGLASRNATRKLINVVEEIKPNIIHLHNIHGYYLNYKILFEYLAKSDIPIVWTLHDCWAFTGHCAYFDYARCNLWETGCHAPCPCKRNYPKSMLLDASDRNWKLKKECFTSVKKITLVPVSDWLGTLIRQSYFGGVSMKVIKNGIDLNVFKVTDARGVKSKYGIGSSKYVIGVASVWEKRKGFDDFLKLVSRISNELCIVLVGLDEKKISVARRNGIIGIPRTENAGELAALYSGAELFLNLTYEDNYPTTNLEAIACGTPVLTYSTGGSPESLNKETGWIVEQGDINEVVKIVESAKNSTNRIYTREVCRTWAEQHFDNKKCFEKYMNLYDSLLLSSRGRN